MQPILMIWFIWNAYSGAGKKLTNANYQTFLLHSSCPSPPHSIALYMLRAWDLLVQSFAVLPIDATDSWENRVINYKPQAYCCYQFLSVGCTIN